MSYQKQNFANGEVLTASQLNHIEDGIAEVESSTNMSLAEKATKEDLKNTIDSTLSVSGKAADAKVTGDALAGKAVIDDTTVGTDAWSSKHLVDMLCPPLEETGNPVQCYPVAGYPLGCKVSWEPAQEGSGTPYPAGGGKNLWGDLLQNTFVSQLGLSAGYSGAKTTGKIPCTEGDKYTLSCATTFAPAPGNIGVLAYFDESDTTLTRVANTYQRAFTLTAPANVAYLRASCLSETDADNVQLEKGTTATAYAPYENIRPIKGRDSVAVTHQESSKTFTLSLPITIYGGTVNAVTGEGQETWKLITLDGKTNKFSSGTTYWNLPRKSAIGVGDWYLNNIYSSHFTNVFGGNAIENFIYTTTAIMAKYFQNADALNAYLAAQYAAGTPVQICYKLKTLTSFTAQGAQPIPALPGVNTLMTDADSVAVTGRADPIKRITDLEDAVASMTNT